MITTVHTLNPHRLVSMCLISEWTRFEVNTLKRVPNQKDTIVSLLNWAQMYKTDIIMGIISSWKRSRNRVTRCCSCPNVDLWERFTICNEVVPALESRGGSYPHVHQQPSYLQTQSRTTSWNLFHLEQLAVVKSLLQPWNDLRAAFPHSISADHTLNTLCFVI